MYIFFLQILFFGIEAHPSYRLSEDEAKAAMTDVDVCSDTLVEFVVLAQSVKKPAGKTREAMNKFLDHILRGEMSEELRTVLNDNKSKIVSNLMNHMIEIMCDQKENSSCKVKNH